MNYKDITKGVLLSYSQIFFSYSQLLGVLLLIVTFFSPWIGLGGLISVILANGVSYLFKYNKEDIEKGYLGFNSLLIGMEIFYFFKPNISVFVLLFIVVISTLLLTVVLNDIFHTSFKLPALTLPFVLMSIVLYFATYNYTGLELRASQELLFNSYNLWKPLELFFSSMSIIFFQNSIEVGIIIAAALLVYSPTMFFLSVVSFASGLFFYSIMGGSLLGVENAFVGFNFIFTGLAIGGIFFVPSISSYLLAIFSVMITALVASSIKTFVVFYGMPVFALPFNLVIFMLLISFKKRGFDNFPKMVDFVPGKPEDNLNFYTKNIKRFGSVNIIDNLALPIKGIWKISQGADGKETHKDRWRWALDFQKLNYENKIYNNSGEKLEDYPTYKSEVYSAVYGVVVALENGIKDNKIGDVNIEHNWGNYIIIDAGFGIYIKVAHLLKGSIKVTLNQSIKVGEVLALVGNSGRSSYPHLHFQVQSMPIVGADTLPFSFSSYIEHLEDKFEIKKKILPKTDQIIENIEQDYSFSEIFNLYINREFKYIYNNSEEVVKVDIDFYGRRFIKSLKNSAKLYFIKDKEFFYFLDFEGDKNSVLYQIYKSLPLIPLTYKEKLNWQDNIYFVTKSLLKDFISFFYSFIGAPHTKFKLNYGKKVRYNGEIAYLVYSNEKKVIFSNRGFLLAIKEGDNMLLEQVEKE